MNNSALQTKGLMGDNPTEPFTFLRATIRNFSRSFQPTKNAIHYLGTVWARRLGLRVKVWCSISLRVLGGVSMLWTSSVKANPVGEQVVGGAATFNRPDAATLIVNQQTDRAVINWNNFSIANGELTRFVQPSSTSAAFNRVVTITPSMIDGALQANGQVWLSNPNGIMVGKGGTVNVGSFVASTHDIATEDFMRGGDLALHGKSDASILNQGQVEARDGDVFLVAKEVKNEGQLMARDGTVGMVSGTEVSLQAIGQGNYKVRLLAAESDTTAAGGGRREAGGGAEIVNEGVIQAANAVLEAKGSYLPMAIKNTGVIEATGLRENGDGSVTLTGGEGDILNTGVVAALQRSAAGVQKGGTIMASAKNITTDPGSIMTASGSEKGGEIKVSASDTIYAGGKMEAKSVEGKGGKIQLTGERVGLFGAEVDASGKSSGGTVLVGGDYLGKNPEVPNAKVAVMTSDSVIRADATWNGDGGKVILWSDEYTGFYGQIFARAGLSGGDGGFVETSSHANLQAWGAVDTFSFFGKAGTWLLDPTELYITTTSSNTDITGGPAGPWIYQPSTGSAGAQSQANANTILQALDAGQDVTIQVNTATGSNNQIGDIIVARSLIVADGVTAGNLTLLAGGATTSYSAAGVPIIGAGVVRAGTGGSIRVNETIIVGGNLTLIAGSCRGDVVADIGGTGGDVLIDAPISSRNGAITLQAGWGLAVNGGAAGGVVTVNQTVSTTGANGRVVITGGSANSADSTGGDVEINAAINLGTSLTTDPIYGYAGSVIASGNSTGGAGGNLTINAPINGAGATITLQSGVGARANPGTFTLATGALVGQQNSVTTRLASVAIRSQTTVDLQSDIFASQITLVPTPIPTATGFSNTGSIWLNETPIEGLNSYLLDNTGISHLFSNLSSSDKIQIGDATFEGDIAIGQAGGVTFAASNLYFLGSPAVANLNRSISFNASSGTCLTFSPVGGVGTLTFDTGGSLFTRFGTAPLDIATSSGGTIDFKRVAATAAGTPSIGQSASQPLRLNVANILSSGTLVGDVYISNASALNFSGGFNMGSSSLNLLAGGAITQTAGTITATGANNVFNASGNNVTLGLANDFGTVQLSFVNSATLRDANAIILATSTLTGALTVNAGGNVTQSGALVVPGTSTITSSGGAITLSNAGNNYTGAVSLSTSGNNAISILDQDAMVLGNLSTAAGTAAVTIVTGGNLTQQSGTSITSLGTGNFTLQATASGTSINLATDSNGNSILNNIASANVVMTGGANFQDFGLRNIAVTADTPSATTGLSLRNLTLIFDNAAISLPATNFNTLSGNLVLTAGGAITQLGALTVPGTTTVTATSGNITLNQANDFQGAVTLTGSGAGTISITDINNLAIGGLTQAGVGDVTISVGSTQATGTASLTQSGAITTGTAGVAGGTFTINASTTGATTSINLSTQDNLIRSANITIGTPLQVNDYQLRNTASVALGNSSINPDPDGGLANFSGSTKIENVSLYYGTLAGVGTAPLTSLGGLTINNSGGLTLFATAIQQTAGTFVVPGTTSVTATTGAINLTLNNNFTGAVSLTTPATNLNAVQITDLNALTLGTLSIGGNLTANSTGVLNLGLGSVGGALTVNSGGGAIIQAGALTISGASSINAGAAAITLTQGGNNFVGTVDLTGGVTQITDANALILGTLATGALTAFSTGALNLGAGSVSGVLTATSSGGNITQTSALTVGGAAFNAGSGDVTMTAANTYNGSVTITANNADFQMAAGATGVDQLSTTRVVGTFTLAPSIAGTTINLANGAGGFELTSTQLSGFSIGTFDLNTALAGNISLGALNPAGIRNLSLTTAGTGNIVASGAVAVRSLSLNSGGTVTFAVPNQIQNLGLTRVTTGGLSLENAEGMNLTGAVTLLNGGNADFTVAGQFYNLSGQETPFAGTTGRAVVRTLSMMGGLPNQISALAGFTPSYNFTDPGTSRAMIYAVSPLAQTAPSGTIIAGVDLSGVQTGGGQFNTFLTGSDNLNWMISDFGKFSLPKVEPARMEYMLYPQRVEPETKSLPQPVMSELTQELGRPPTIGEIYAREIANRSAARAKTTSILEKSSFDDDQAEPQQEARAQVPEPDGGKPQAGAKDGSFAPQASRQVDTLRDPNRTTLRGGPKKAVVFLRAGEAEQRKDAAESSTQASNQRILNQERARAEVGTATPFAESR